MRFSLTSIARSRLGALVSITSGSAPNIRKRSHTAAFVVAMPCTGGGKGPTITIRRLLVFNKSNISGCGSHAAAATSTGCSALPPRSLLGSGRGSVSTQYREKQTRPESLHLCTRGISLLSPALPCSSFDIANRSVKIGIILRNSLPGPRGNTCVECPWLAHILSEH